MHSQQIIKFSSFISYFQHSAIFHVISLIKTRFSIYNKDYSTRAIFMGWCPKLWVTIFISLNINTFHFTSFFFQNTQRDYFRSWLTAVHATEVTWWWRLPIDKPQSPFTLLPISDSDWPFLVLRDPFCFPLNFLNYTSFSTKDTGSTFFCNVGNCLPDCPG